MATNTRDLVLRWVGDVSKLTASTKEVDKAVNKSADNAEKAGDQAGKGFGQSAAKGISSTAKKLAATFGALFAFDKIKDFAKQAYDEARESQKVGAQTNAVIKSTGGAAKITAKQVSALATSISNKTGIDDENIQTGENMLLTFKNIRNEAGKGNKIFDQTTQIMTDMSVATGKDMSGSAVMLGKALNDPTKGISALSRVGVTFTDQQKKQIKALQDSGDTMGAQKIILRELKSEFGGSAAAQATAGEKLTATWKNFQEEIGTAFLPVVDKIMNVLSQKLLPALTKLFDLMLKHKKTVLILAGVLVTVVAAMKALSLVTEINTGLTALATIATKVFGNAEKTTSVQTKLVAAAQWLWNAALSANPIGIVVIAIAALVAGLILAYKHSEKFRKIVNETWSLIKKVALGVLNWFKNSFIPFFTTTLPNTFKSVLGWLKKNWPTILAIITGPLGLAVLAVAKNWDKIKNAFKSVKEWVSGTWRKGWNNVRGWIGDAAQAGRDRVAKALGPDGVRGRFANLKDWASGAWRKGWNNVKDWIAHPVQNARDAVAAAKTRIRDTLATLDDWGRHIFGKRWAGIKDALVKPFQVARDVIGKIMGKNGLRKTLTNALAGLTNVLVKGIGNPIRAAINGIFRVINVGLIRNGINWLLGKLGVQKKNQLPWIPVNIPKLAHGGRVRGRNAYERAGTDRVLMLGDRDEMMIGRGAVRSLDNALPGGLDYLNKTGRWPVGPAAETSGAYQNTPRGPNAPVNMNGIPGNLAAIIRRGPRPGDRSGFGGPNPVAWANSKVGDMGWYNRCLAFVNAAWNFTVGRFRVATARQSAMAGPRNMRGMPPAGAGVYWDTGPAGHIALAAGDGSVFSNDIRQAGRIDRVPQQEINKWGPYMGWWHPNGANTSQAGWNPGGAGGGILGALGGLTHWIGNLDPIQWLKKRVGSFAHKAGIAGGMFGNALSGSVPGMILGRAKDWLLNKFGMAGSAAAGSISGVSGWNADQLKNAAVIVSIARSLGFGDRGAQIALITAMQESTLRNLNYGDRDSLGLFQQRAPWGPASARTNPAQAARMFLLGGRGGQPGLRAFPWRTMGLAQAAQAVQVSAFPDAYAKWIGQAAAMLGKFKVLDHGGRLATGPSLVYNGTGQSERVLSPAEERRLGATTVINIHVDGSMNDDRALGRLIRAIEAYERRRGPVIVQRAAA